MENLRDIMRICVNTRIRIDNFDSFFFTRIMGRDDLSIGIHGIINTIEDDTNIKNVNKYTKSFIESHIKIQKNEKY